MPTAAQSTLPDVDPPHTPSPDCGCDLCFGAFEVDTLDDGDLPFEFRWAPAGSDAVQVA